MGEKVLVINTGSTSHKYAVYDNSRLILSFHFETNGDKFILNSISEKGKEVEEIPGDIFFSSLKYVRENTRDIKIDYIVVRVVAPGIFFSKDRIFDEEYLSKLKKIESRDPLHISPTIELYKNIVSIFTGIKVIGISDSSFHFDENRELKIYPLPYEDTEKFELYRYGYHGISIGSVVRKMKEEKSLSEKVIICHLGGGSSISAILEGKSIENSMGYSPLEGLMMATRTGNIDSMALLVLQEEKGLSISQIKNYLYKECGMKGVSGLSSDTRVLLEAEKDGGERGARASRALQLYIQKIKKEIGSQIAILNGVDTLVFTGTIGERSSIMRERICTDLEYLGIHLDLIKNKNNESENFNIEIENSPVKIKVIHTEEEKEMAYKASLI